NELKLTIAVPVPAKNEEGSYKWSFTEAGRKWLASDEEPRSWETVLAKELAVRIDEFMVSVRVYNGFKNANVRDARGIVQLLIDGKRFKAFGRKSFLETEALMRE